MKKQMWAFLFAMVLVGGFFTIYFIVNEKNEENLPEREIAGPKTLEQTMYETIITMLENTPLPTYHDQNGNPFERVYAATDRNGEYNFVQVDVMDAKTGLNYMYMVCDFSFEYDHVKTNGNIVDIGNGQTVYKYNTTYAWKDEKTGYYSHVMFGDGMEFRDVQNILLSFGKSKYDVLTDFNYKKNSNVVRANYVLNNEKLQSITFEQSLNDEGQGPKTNWSALYESYKIDHSFSFDYTLELIENKQVGDEQAARKSMAMIDKEKNIVTYKDDEIGSIRISSYWNNEVDLTGEFIKVIDSLK